jgi:hypothetical protein
MHRTSILSLVLVAGLSAGAAAQQQPMTMAMNPKMPAVTGIWDAKTMVGPKDSVVVTEVLTMTPDAKGWTMAFPGRTEAVPVRVMSAAGDSVVTESGPYASALRAGQMVTVRMVAHYKGDAMWGTAVATYGSGDKLNLKMSATRRK